MASTMQDGELIEFHPMKGPMITQTLRGLAGQEPYHWRGDRADFAAFNPAFDGLMGGSQLSPDDMVAFTTFINTILYQPNPNQKLDRSFPAAVSGGDPAAGFDNFVNLELAIQGADSTPRSCNSCHQANPGPGSDGVILIFQSAFANRVQPLKVPQLRNLYQKTLFNIAGPESIGSFGFDHDGRIPDLENFFKGLAFSGYSEQQKLDIAAFLMTFDTGTAPAVGYSRTINVTSIGRAGSRAAVSLLVEQAKAGNIDLVVHGIFNGEVNQLLYLPGLNRFFARGGSVGPFTTAELGELILGGDVLTFMGVYPGTGLTVVR